jgi:hypothetical protein
MPRFDVCACCGAGGMLAQVMDPFSDSCFAVCRSCMSPLLVARGLTLREELASCRDAHATSTLLGPAEDVETLRDALAALFETWEMSADSLGPEWIGLGSRLEEVRRALPALQRLRSMPLAAAVPSGPPISRHPLHHCVMCGSEEAPGEGCGNCRQTGFDQTPCMHPDCQGTAAVAAPSGETTPE